MKTIKTTSNARRLLFVLTNGGKVKKPTDGQLDLISIPLLRRLSAMLVS